MRLLAGCTLKAQACFMLCGEKADSRNDHRAAQIITCGCRCTLPAGLRQTGQPYPLSASGLAALVSTKRQVLQKLCDTFGKDNTKIEACSAEPMESSANCPPSGLRPSPHSCPGARTWGQGPPQRTSCTGWSTVRGMRYQPSSTWSTVHARACAALHVSNVICQGPARADQPTSGPQLHAPGHRRLLSLAGGGASTAHLCPPPQGCQGYTATYG